LTHTKSSHGNSAKSHGGGSHGKSGGGQSHGNGGGGGKDHGK
jgi:hypothetical protein